MSKTKAIFELLMFEAEVEKNLFLVSLISVTIQGDGKEREKEWSLKTFQRTFK